MLYNCKQICVMHEIVLYHSKNNVCYILKKNYMFPKYACENLKGCLYNVNEFLPKSNKIVCIIQKYIIHVFEKCLTCIQFCFQIYIFEFF